MRSPSTAQYDIAAMLAERDEIVSLLVDDPERAVVRLRIRARKDDAQAQLALGQLLINGVGTPRDAEEALHWFRAAACVELPMAINMVGRCHEYGYGTPVDYGLAAVWFRRAAALDCDWAIYNYAHLLANGRGVARDRAAAFDWFRRAAHMGHARAMHFLGVYHENGWETPVDKAAAAEWYRRSAEGGDFRGQCSHASVLAERGQVDEALVWLRRAAGTATPVYLRCLAEVLAESPHAALREFSGTLVAGTPRDFPAEELCA